MFNGNEDLNKRRSDQPQAYCDVMWKAENIVPWAGGSLMMIILLSFGIAGTHWLLIGACCAPVLAFVALKKPEIFLLGFYVCLLPFDALLSISDDASGAKMTKLLGVAAILTFVVKGMIEGKFEKPQGPIIWWVLFLFYSAATMLWAIDPGTIKSKLLTLTGLVLLYVIIACYRFQSGAYGVLKRFIFVGGVAAGFWLLYNYITGDFYNTYHMKASLMLGERGITPDAQAFVIIIPFAVGLSFVLERPKRMEKMVLILLTLVVFGGIVVTGTRGALIACLVMTLVFLINARRKLRFAFAVLIAALAIAPLIPENVVERTLNMVQEGGSGRRDIWMVGIEALKEHWLIGAGFNNFPAAYDKVVDKWPIFKGLSRAPHNIFLGTWVELGILGLVLLIVAIIRHYQVLNGKQPQGADTMAKSAFWGIITASFFVDPIAMKSFWLLWIIIVIYQKESESLRLVERASHTVRRNISLGEKDRLLSPH